MRICAIKGQTQHPFLSAKQLVNRYNLCLSGRAVRVTLCTFKHRSSVSERLVDYRPKNIHMFHPQPSSLAGASRPEKPSVQASLPPPSPNMRLTGKPQARTPGERAAPAVYRQCLEMRHCLAGSGIPFLCIPPFAPSRIGGRGAAHGLSAAPLGDGISVFTIDLCFPSKVGPPLD